MTQQSLKTVHEGIVLPQLPIIDSHMHLWDRIGFDYFAPEFLADVADGHDVRSSLYVECGMAYDALSSDPMLAVDETRYVQKQIALAKGSPHRLAEGILGAANLLLGNAVQPVLDAHAEAAQGRFRGVRFRVAFDDDPEAGYHESGYLNENVMDRSELLDSARILARMGLTLELWGFHPQLAGIKAFARKVPEVTIVLNHIGGPLGVGRYAQMRDEVFREWSQGMSALAEEPNVMVKISGLGISRLGLRQPGGQHHTTSDHLVKAWGPFVRHCVEAFGPDRSIFGSNFPVDRATASYRTLLNAYKKMLIDLSETELRAIFAENARRTYRLA
ncbi:amidohydrolase family protein [Paracoccus pantotrophus]|uniref:amidohydrolase family protein n=1 Tax=Paracoccus pantotrophus TaxID=82367 RepID=UPI00048A62BF|nr:amidohydrolase family protein [Paracoccus pantotrophus]